MEHLYRMGESSASYHRSVSVGKDTMIAAAAIYDGTNNLKDKEISGKFLLFSVLNDQFMKIQI